MNLELARVFCNIAERKSILQGAAASHISQPLASQDVRRLEEELGVQLLDRSTRPLRLTPAGTLCYAEFRRVLRLYDSLINRLQSPDGQVAGTVRVAAIYSIGLHGLGNAMQEFLKSCSKAKVQLEYLRPHEVYDAVRDGKADLGIVSYPVARSDLGVIPLRSEKMVFVCHPDHPLAGAASIPLPSLDGEDFVGFDRDLPIRKAIDDCLREHSASVRIVMEFDNIETIKHAVEIGAGVSLLPEPTVCRETRTGILAVASLTGCELRRPVGVIHQERLVFTPAMIRFVELLEKAEVQSLAEAG